MKIAGDQLETTWLGEKIRMLPESDRTFRFVRDNSGKVNALVISVPEELTLRKLP